LYGTTQYGGTYQYGTVFKLTQSNGKWQETVLHSFTNWFDGSLPDGGLALDSLGNLYGTSEIGGANGLGLVYEITP